MQILHFLMDLEYPSIQLLTQLIWVAIKFLSEFIVNCAIYILTNRRLPYQQCSWYQIFFGAGCTAIIFANREALHGLVSFFGYCHPLPPFLCKPSILNRCLYIFPRTRLSDRIFKLVTRSKGVSVFLDMWLSVSLDMSDSAYWLVFTKSKELWSTQSNW